MLLEAPGRDSSRTMPPALEAAFPSGTKHQSEKMKEADKGFGSDVFPGHPVSQPWSKTTNRDGLKSRMYGQVAMPGVVRCLPERPEPVYPPSYKMPSLPSPSPDSDHLSPGSHHKKMDYPESKRPPLVPRSHHLQMVVPRPEVPPSSMSMRNPTSCTLMPSRNPPAAFFRGGFPHVSGFPPPGPPYMGMPPHGPPHAHPGGPNSFPGGPVSAPGFMSLAHILFQPKYPMGKKTFQCHECRYITDRKNNLKRHIATMHQDCGKFLECCDTIFRSKAALRDHVLLYHRTGYKCRFCGRNFCRKALLKRHLAVHNGQKEYICEVCDYATSHKSNLERHRKVHGLGSPLGSDDGEHFLQDGPDAEGYVRHFRGFQEHPPASSLGQDMEIDISDEDRDVDVESSTIDEDESDRGATEGESELSPMNHQYNESHPTPDSSQSDPKPEVIQNDPLLQAFPINLVINKKQSGKKHKSKLYFSDRLRQTHEPEEIISDTEVHSRSPSPEKTIPISSNDSAFESGANSDNIKQELKDLPKHLERPFKRDSRLNETSPLLKTSSATNSRENSSSSQRSDSGSGRTEHFRGSSLRVPMGTSGCRRLYASPYKCSECGLGLSSQRVLVQHAMICRKVGIEPPRPIQSLAAGEVEGMGRVGAGEEPARAGPGDGLPRDSLKSESQSVLPKFQNSVEYQSRKRPAIDVQHSEKVSSHENIVSSELEDTRKCLKMTDLSAHSDIDVEETPRDYSVKNLLRYSPRSEGRGETGKDIEKVRDCEMVQNSESCSSPEEQGRSLPIKKRSLNQFGK